MIPVRMQSAANPLRIHQDFVRNAEHMSATTVKKNSLQVIQWNADAFCVVIASAGLVAATQRNE